MPDGCGLRVFARDRTHVSEWLAAFAAILQQPPLDRAPKRPGRAKWSPSDDNNRLVRGDRLPGDLEDLRSPSVNAIALSPQAYPVMIWDVIPLRNGRFQERRRLVERLHQRRILRAERRGGRRDVRALSSDLARFGLATKRQVNWNDDFVDAGGPYRTGDWSRRLGLRGNHRAGRMSGSLGSKRVESVRSESCRAANVPFMQGSWLRHH